MFNFLICAALSPLQVVLFRGSVCMKRERITIFSPSDVTSRDTFLADIVYVHGLDSNPLTTTERSSEKVSWVRDLLPKENLNCRIMAFNYDTRWMSNALSKSLKDLGDDLIHALASKRETLEEKSRPIILIGYSFGGLIIDQAVVNMVQNSDLEPEILESLGGFVFLSTPHRGSKLTPIGEIISLFGYWRGSDTALLKVMKVGSDASDDLYDRIHSFIYEKDMSRKTLCVFEAQREFLWGIAITHVVDRESAVIQGTMKRSAERLHREIQGCQSLNDETNANKTNAHLFRPDPDSAKLYAARPAME
ncbi:hypothetical protein CBS147355_9437 [Penicillium roqueforti]|nr:hypothetical protein CBS147355_9437 [Penicillium roqueforti]